MSHLVWRLAAFLELSGPLHFRIMAAIAYLRTGELGARPSTLKAMAGLMSGMTGHPQFADGLGSSGILPSPSRISGQLPLDTFSVLCRSSTLPAGNSMHVYFITTPLSALLAFAGWHTSLLQNLPIPC